MGLLVNGVWQDRWYDTASTGGRFVRADSRFRSWVTADGSSAFKAEADATTSMSPTPAPGPTAP